MKRSSRRTLALAVSVCGLVLLANVAFANHSWGNYHWARTSNPFLIKLGDNVSSAWDGYLVTASSDWSQSQVLDTTIVPGGTGGARRCPPTLGRVEICNDKYGQNGWLGIASIWANGDHITQGTVKMNDTYFNMSQYNTPAYRQFVMCQEIGHTFGLDHQDEIFNNANLGSCMDYTNDPDGGAGGASSNDPANTSPNQHDYDQLLAIYGHLDSTTTIGQSLASGKGNARGDSAEWGRLVRTTNSGRTSLFVRDFGNGEKIFTFVIWADEADAGN